MTSAVTKTLPAPNLGNCNTQKLMAHKKSTGRRASQQARTIAAELIASYGPIIPSKEAGMALLGAWKHLAETGWLPTMDSDLPVQKSSVGRGAADESRDAAMALVRIWGPALLSPSGTFCVNPDDHPEDQVTVLASQATRALFDAMVRLADTGWLVETKVSLERFMIRETYKEIRTRTERTKAALEELANIYPRSIRDLERIIRGVEVPGVKSRSRRP